MKKLRRIFASGLAVIMMLQPAVTSRADTGEACLWFETGPVSEDIKISTPSNVGHGTGYIKVNYSASLIGNGGKKGLKKALFGLTIPSAYSSIEKGYSTAIKDQELSNMCWAFSYASAAETNMLRNNNVLPEDCEYSPLGLSYFFYHIPQDPLRLIGAGTENTIVLDDQTYLTMGGSYLVTAFSLSGWIGTIEESEIPFESPYGGSAAASYDFDEYKPVAVQKGAYFLNTSEKAKVKEAIMKYGSAAVGFCASDSLGSDSAYGHLRDNGSGQTDFYVYHPASTGEDHEVQIVGWDDSISKNLFKTSSGDVPSGNGAWLVRNSWGEEWPSETAEHAGCFWISYEDTSLDATVVAVEMESGDSYYHNYHYDGNASLSYKQLKGAATVFRAQTSETVTDVCMGFKSTNVSYTISVYTSDSRPASPTSGVLASQVSGTTTAEGFYTAELETPVSVAKNSWFSVVVTTSDSAYYFCEDSESSFGEAYVRMTADVNPGEGFISSNGSSWTDGYSLANPCTPRIKAFTKADGKYLVRWENADGTLLQLDQDVVPETVPSYVGQTPELPDQEGYRYTFEGWNRDISEVSGDQIYKAVYKKEKISTEKIYWGIKNGVLTISTKDQAEEGIPSGLLSSISDQNAQPWKNDRESIKKVIVGEDAEDVVKPSSTAYWFYGLSKATAAEFNGFDTSNVTNMESMFTGCIRLAEIKKGANTKFGTGVIPAPDSEYIEGADGNWYDENSQAYSLDKMGQAGAGTYKALPGKFDVAITADHAEYGDVSKASVTAEYGSTISADGAALTIGTETVTAAPKTATAQYTYSFKEWSGIPAEGKVTGAVTITAVFERTVNTYTVIWKNGTATVETDSGVEYGTKPSFDGEDPKKVADAQYTYTFTGWSPAITEDTVVTGDVTYTAQFSSAVNKYDVSVSVNSADYGSVNKSSFNVDYGTAVSADGAALTIGTETVTAAPKTATAQYTYTVKEWSGIPSGGKVTGAATITAVFERTVNKYTITWKDDTGKTIDTTKAAYGQIPTHADPAKTATAGFSYTFTGWSPAVTGVTGAASYQATFSSSKRKYTVAWKNADGTVLKTDTVEYGKTPEYSGAAPEKRETALYTYTFRGWSPMITAVAENAVYTAEYTETKKSDIQPEEKEATIEVKVVVKDSDPEGKKEAVEEIGNNEAAKVTEGLSDAVRTEELFKSITTVDPKKVTESSIGIKVDLERLEVSEGGTAVQSMSFEIHPVITIEQEGKADVTYEVNNRYLDGRDITIRIPVPEKTAGTCVEVTHKFDNGTSAAFKAKIQGSGKNRYVEITVTQFSIFELSFTDTYYTIRTIPTQTYTGKAVTPAVTVMDGSKTLDKSAYTVSYENNTEAGTAKAIVTILATGDVLTQNFTISKGTSGGTGGGGSSSGGGGGGGSSSGGGGGGGGGGSSSGPKSSASSGAAGTFSRFWQDVGNGVWKITNSGQFVTSAWLCDDAVAANGQNVWYLMNTDGTMLAAGLVQDNTGNFYSLETTHNGYYGMLRYKNGTYDCNGQQVYLEFSNKHDGTFGAVINADGLAKLQAIYGVTRFGIGNDRCQYTSTFK